MAAPTAAMARRAGHRPVITRKRITAHAHNPTRGMTLDEIAAWLDYARASGGTGTDVPHVAVNRHHGLTILSLDIAGDPAR